MTAKRLLQRGDSGVSEPQANSSALRREEKSMPNGKQVILVVEDHPIIRMGAVELVRSAGFDAIEAETADEAIRILESRADIRLVFTDVEMPGTMDGHKLALYVRDRWPPVMLIVASGKRIIAESALPPGTRFFQKPYNDNAIVEAIIGMLA